MGCCASSGGVVDLAPGDRVVATGRYEQEGVEWYKPGDKGIVWSVAQGVTLKVSVEGRPAQEFTNTCFGLTMEQASALQAGSEVVSTCDLSDGQGGFLLKEGEKGTVTEIPEKQTLVSVTFDRSADDPNGEIFFELGDKSIRRVSGPSSAFAGPVRTDADGDAVLPNGDVITGGSYDLTELTRVEAYRFRLRSGKVARGYVTSDGHHVASRFLGVPGFPHRGAGQEWEAVLSVRFDEGSLQADTAHCRDDATTLAYEMLQEVPMAVYYPNAFSKSQYLESGSRFPGHNTDYKSCRGHDCPFYISGRGGEPTPEWCWAGSFYWHLERCYRHNPKKAMMIQVQVGSELGIGQEIEQKMADHLGLTVVKICCPENEHPDNGESIARQLHEAGVVIWDGKVDVRRPMSGYRYPGFCNLKRRPA